MLIRKQISGLFLLFSSKRVYCQCGARHNADLNLSGTESDCAGRLWSYENLFNKSTHHLPSMMQPYQILSCCHKQYQAIH